MMNLGPTKANLNFEIISEIGQEGKNSQVFLAHDFQFDGQIVVKKISKNRIVHSDQYFNESKLLYSSRHQNVVQVHYGCEDEDSIYIAMPYYGNGSLKSLTTSHFLSTREIIRYSIQFLNGLNHIHSKGLMHFDVKLDNILVSDTNEALLSDFGLAAAMDSFGFAEQNQVYIRNCPPERFSQSKFTHQYDIYMAALAIYNLCNGLDNFYNQFGKINNRFQDAIINGNFPDRNSYLPHVPKKLRDSINKALNVDPSLRHENVLEFINELGAIDSNLDWRFAPISGIEKWEKNLPNKFLNIEITKNNHTFDLIALKTVSGKTKRVNKFCQKNVPISKYQKILENTFKKFD